MNKNKENEILDRLHQIREELYIENRKVPYPQQVEDDNKKSEEILKKWNVALEKAEYLLHLVK